MSIEAVFAGVDLGGTSIKMALISEAGTPLTKTEVSTPVEEGGEAVVQKIADTLFRLAEEQRISRDQIKGLGIGAPAFMDIEKGFVYQAVNLGWKDFALKDKLEAATGWPVVVDNDANIAAIGEMWRGAGQGARHLICVTLGTGVGGGIIINGDILHGANGMAGEIGHVTVVPEGGVPCTCGKSGCLERYASATGIIREGREAVENKQSPYLEKVAEKEGTITAKDVADGVRAGDPRCKEILNQAAYYLGLTLAQLSNTINPEKIVIGGGVSKAGDTLFKPINEYFNRYALRLVKESVQILPAELGNDAGFYGAAWLAKNKAAKLEA